MQPSTPPISPRPFLSFALFGFLLSVGIHGLSLRGVSLPFALMIPLHLGVFVAWIPAILLLLPQMQQAGREAGAKMTLSFWRTALRASPRWMRWTLALLTVYAIINFLLIMVPQLTAPPNSLPARGVSFDSAEALRLFSAQWMLFYGAGYAVLDSYLRSDDKTGL